MEASRGGTWHSCILLVQRERESERAKEAKVVEPAVDELESHKQFACQVELRETISAGGHSSCAVIAVTW